MFLKSILLVTIFELIQARIVLDITADPYSNNDIVVKYSGSEESIVNDEDVRLFHIDDKNLKDAVGKYYGKKPNDVFVKSPTRWGDLYETYNWPQVTRVLSVKSAEVKGNTNNPVIIQTQDFINDSNNTIKVNTGIRHTVENSLSTTWTKNEQWSVSQSLKYNINFIFTKIEGTTAFSYSNSWGVSTEQSESTVIGTTSDIATELAPGQAVTSVLSASVGSLEVVVEHQVNLRGVVAVNYKKPYKGHHFYGADIQEVMESGSIKNEVLLYETIKLRHYFNATLRVYDKVSHATLDEITL